MYPEAGIPRSCTCSMSPPCRSSCSRAAPRPRHRRPATRTAGRDRRRRRRGLPDRCRSRSPSWAGVPRGPSALGAASPARFTNQVHREVRRSPEAADGRLEGLARQPPERARASGPGGGGRNHFGSTSRRGTWVASVLYSVLETAKLCHVDPAACLVEATTRARRGDTTPLMPWDYARLSAEVTSEQVGRSRTQPSSAAWRAGSHVSARGHRCRPAGRPHASSPMSGVPQTGRGEDIREVSVQGEAPPTPALQTTKPIEVGDHPAQATQIALMPLLRRVSSPVAPVLPRTP